MEVDFHPHIDVVLDSFGVQVQYKRDGNYIEDIVILYEANLLIDDGDGYSHKGDTMEISVQDIASPSLVTDTLVMNGTEYKLVKHIDGDEYTNTFEVRPA